MFNNFIVWITAGAVIGWLVGRVWPTRDGKAINVLLGVVGACAAAWFLSPRLGISTSDEEYFSFPALLVSLLGASLLLGVVTLFRRPSTRPAGRAAAETDRPPGGNLAEDRYGHAITVDRHVETVDTHPPGDPATEPVIGEISTERRLGVPIPPSRP